MDSIINKPMNITFVTLIIWSVARIFLPDLKADEGLIRTTISTLSTFWGILAAFIFARVWSHWSEIAKAVKQNDLEAFLLNKDQRLPQTGKDLLKILSYLLLGAFFLLSFNNALIGIYTIGSITFTLSLYIIVIEDLDDPFTGFWNVGKLPTGWDEKIAKLEKRK